MAAGCGLQAWMQAHGQMHVVKKPETVVRAVGVYEWTGDEDKPKASRLVPVTLFIDGKLEDAGVYLARPVPMALQTGTVFELDQAGVADGTLEVSFARHIQSATGGPDGPVDDGWMGYGPFKPQPKPKLVAAKKSGPLSKIVQTGGKPDSGPKFANTPADTKTDAKADTKTDSGESDRPVLKRKTDADTDSSKSTSADPAAKPDDETDRPTLKRKTADADAAPDTTASTRKTPVDTADPNSEAERPTLRKRTPEQRQDARKQHDSSSVSGVGSLNDDPDRPSLHRGKAPGSMGEDDLPALMGLPPDMHQQVAVSDAANRPQHDFNRAWADEAERASVLATMQKFAREKLAGYGAAVKSPVAPVKSAAPAPTAAALARMTPAQRAAARRKAAASKALAAAAPVQAELKDEVLKGYTLSYGGAATYFYSASSTGADGVARFVSVVAQKEELGGMRVAMASVTDALHLDRTPQYRLVDVVDVEASNRASLLMELRAQHSRQFALYRVIGAEAQQTFVGGTTE